MRCILALDQGTTSSRAIVFDEAGSIRGTAQQERAAGRPFEGTQVLGDGGLRPAQVARSSADRARPRHLAEDQESPRVHARS
jgi:glycerol kinase